MLYYVKSDKIYKEMSIALDLERFVKFDVSKIGEKVSNQKAERIIVCFYLDLLKSVNIPVNDINTEIFFNKNLLSQMKEYLPNTKKKQVLIHFINNNLKIHFSLSY